MIQLFILLSAQLVFGAVNSKPESSLKLEGPDIRPSFAININYSPIHYKDYEFTPGVSPSLPGQALLLSLDWMVVREYGKLSVGAGTGFFWLQNQKVQLEQFATLVAIPIEATARYHFEYTENQLIVPYVSLGTSGTYVRQQSSTGAVIPDTKLYQGWEHAMGAQLCLNNIDRHGAKSFRRLTGVDNTYLVFEYKKSQPLYGERTPNLANESFRFGVRLEI